MPYRKDARTGSYDPYAKSAAEFDKALRSARAQSPWQSPIPDERNPRVKYVADSFQRRAQGVGTGNTPEARNARIKDEMRRREQAEARRQNRG